MGQHKIDGASKGGGYKAAQKIRHRLRMFKVGKEQAGKLVRTRRGTYRVREDGSYERIGKENP